MPTTLMESSRRLKRANRRNSDLPVPHRTCASSRKPRRQRVRDNTSQSRLRSGPTRHQRASVVPVRGCPHRPARTRLLRGSGTPPGGLGFRAGTRTQLRLRATAARVSVQPQTTAPAAAANVDIPRPDVPLAGALRRARQGDGHGEAAGFWDRIRAHGTVHRGLVTQPTCGGGGGQSLRASRRSSS